MDDITTLGQLLPRFLIELLIAIVCGGLIGLERGIRQKAANLRDYILVCVGAVLFMIIGELITLHSSEGVNGDPARIASQIIVAIGLLGMGVVISQHRDASGLTIAISIWLTAGIGMIIGTGYPLLGLLVTGVVLLTLTMLHGLEEKIARRPRSMFLRLTIREDTPELRKLIQTTLEKEGVHPQSFRAESGPAGIKLTINAPNEPRDYRTLTAALWTLPGIIEVEH
jgi:putative Mg2+ transporter-C (MgtC) family protein